MKYIFCFIFISFSFLSAQDISSLPAELQNALFLIKPEEIKAHTVFLSDDLLEGRGTGTRGEKIAANYIASQFQAIGLEPIFPNSSYFQKIPIIGVKTKLSGNFIIKNQKNDLYFKNLEDFVISSEQAKKIIELNDEIVFVGYGIDAPEYGWNDYKNKDVSGKILLILNDEPKSEDSIFFAGKARTYYGRWTYKFETAAQRGAKGAIIIYTDSSAGYGWDVVVNSWAGENYYLKNEQSKKLLLNIWMREPSVEKFLNLSAYELKELYKRANNKNFYPVDLNLRLNVKIQNQISEIETQNVAGVIRGMDDKLKNEYIIHSAHYDHLGIGQAVDGDSIYNGASDNAIGVALMISVAKAFKTVQKDLKRSIIFLACAAEENGSLGSEFFVKNSPVPVQNIVANFNTDGANFIELTNDISFIGIEKSTLDSRIKKVLNKIKIKITPDKYPESGSFYRSDQFSFARVGIPAVGVRGGSDFIKEVQSLSQILKQRREVYHQPSDTVAYWWNFEATAQQARIVFLCEYETANQDVTPYWYQNQEFNRNK